MIQIPVLPATSLVLCDESFKIPNCQPSLLTLDNTELIYGAIVEGIK